MKKSPWKILSTKKIYDNPWIGVVEHQVLTPAKKPGIYGVVQFKNIAVGVVAIDEKDRVLLVGQYRFPQGRYSWEIPEGGCPKGEKPPVTAKRELAEETGYSAKSMKKILDLHLSNSTTDERAEVFLASDLKLGQAAPEETEVLKIKWVTFKRAVQMIEKGEITDAISVAALLRVALLRSKLGSDA
ncbi:MAG: NUDIX hydrolase [Proteobacteria bacterium]|nr:MAG: NUDIX hydrolase [Pseudomonadota bacterium]